MTREIAASLFEHPILAHHRRRPCDLRAVCLSVVPGWLHLGEIGSVRSDVSRSLQDVPGVQYIDDARIPPASTMRCQRCPASPPWPSYESVTAHLICPRLAAATAPVW